MSRPAEHEIQFLPARTPQALEQVRTLFHEYQASLTIDLCFQGFAEELAGLPGDYAEPEGLLLLAVVNGTPAGCGGFRALRHSDHVNACEMKRLFVRPAYRRIGLGRQMAVHLMSGAQLVGYSTMLLDTLSEMETARALYQELGFAEVAPYYLNPVAGAHHLKAEL